MDRAIYEIELLPVLFVMVKEDTWLEEAFAWYINDNTG